MRVTVGDKFYFIANSGWDVKPGGAFEAPAIRVMNWDTAPSAFRN